MLETDLEAICLSLDLSTSTSIMRISFCQNAKLLIIHCPRDSC